MSSRLSSYALLGMTLTLTVGTACSSDGTTGPSKDDIRESTGGKADGADACATYRWYGDGECDNFCAQRDSDCTIDTPISTLLHRLPTDLAWTDASPSVREVLAEKTARTFKQTRDEWGQRALSNKEYTLTRYPTTQMTDALAGWSTARFGVASVQNTALATELKKLYLVNVAMSRITMSLYHGAPALEWDGAGPLKGFSLPDRPTVNAQKRYAARIVTALRAIPTAGLSADDAAVLEKALYAARSLATGSIGSFALGGRDLTTGPGLAGWSYDIAWARTPDGGAAYDDDASFLEAVNAYFGGELDYVNRGTVLTTTQFDWPGDDTFIGLLGDPATSVAAHDFLLLGHFWLQRVEAHPHAEDACTIYSERERAEVWDSFSADTGFNNDGSTSLAGHQAAVDLAGQALLANAQGAALGAVDALFPELDPAVRQRVVDQLASETATAKMAEKLASALDAATGNTTASDHLRAELETLVTLGGYDAGAPVSEADAQLGAAMWQEVRTWLAAQYAGGPVDIASLVPETIKIENRNGSFTDPEGLIQIGISLKKSKAEIYSTMLHEAHHAISFRAGAKAGGPGWEGAAVTVERQLLPAFLASVMTGDQAAKLPLYRLALLPGATRLVGNTNATLAVYLRESCDEGEPDTVDYVKQVVGAWGMEGDVADISVLRAHNNAQYLGYMLGDAMYGDVLAYLENAIRPDSDDGIDPYDLLKCGIFKPAKDQATVDAVRGCLGL